MSRPNGRPIGNARQRAMRFALWADRQANEQGKPPSAVEIAKVLDVSLVTAREWRADWFSACHPAFPLPGEIHATPV